MTTRPQRVLSGPPFIPSGVERRLHLILLSTLLAACSPTSAPMMEGTLLPVHLGDAGVDAGIDAGNPFDAGVEDAGVDAGPVDAGPVDAGLEDAGADAGAPSCPAGALFCEDFERGLDAATWSTNGNAAAFAIDPVQSHDGTRSLHFRYGTPYAITGNPTVQLRTPPAVPNDRVYLRVWLRFGDLSLPGQHPAFLDVADSSGREQAFGSIINDFALLAWTPGSGGLDNARIWYEGGGNQWHPGREDGDLTPLVENGLTAGSWFCVELMFFGDHQFAGDTAHPNEETKVWINGTEIPQLAASDALWRQELGHDPPEHWSPVYDRARWRLGLDSFGPHNVSLDLWFDSLVLSTTPIGCQ